MGGEYVRLGCSPEVLLALAGGLTHYAPATGQPEWLVSGVWLYAESASYLATASVKILGDGFVARSLSINKPEDLLKHLEAELPNVADRLSARGNGTVLPSVELPLPPEHFDRWTSNAYTTKVLVRVSPRASHSNRIACGLLFTAEDGTCLLVGSDPSTLALVFSEDPELIGRYREDCEELTPAEYLASC